MTIQDFIKTTRWDRVDTTEERYRLRCNSEDCSMSCANVSNGKLSITSVHGGERHTSMLSNRDMLFVTLQYLNSLSSKDLDSFCNLFNVNFSKVLLTKKEIFKNK